MTVALDDFGTGFSSLTYLRKLPFSRIKIDQSFIRDMLTQPDCAAIVKSVISLAQDLQIGVVAEGVETADQLEYLRQTSCDEVAGLSDRPPAMSGGEISRSCSITIRDGRCTRRKAERGELDAVRPQPDLWRSPVLTPCRPGASERVGAMQGIHRDGAAGAGDAGADLCGSPASGAR